MKRNFEWSRYLSFHSLRFRLLAYLLISGSVPILLALFLFYQQSVQFAQHEYEAYITQNHNRIVQEMQKDFVRIEEEAIQFNKDKSIQQAMKMGPGDVSLLGELGEELNRRLEELIAEDLPVSVGCFHFSESALSVCNDTAILRTIPPESPQGARIETFEAGIDEPVKLRYVAPLYEIGSKEMRGYLVFLIDQNRLPGLGDGYLPILEQSLLLDSGYFEASINETSGGIVSVQPVEAFSTNWKSTIRWENRKYDELRGSVGRMAIGLIVLLAMLSVTIALLFERSVTKPIQVLRKLMNRAELGDLRAYWTSGAAKEIDELGETYNQMLNRLDDLIKQVKVEESQKKEKEFEALQYQLNPHFLYNTLNTIKWVAKIHKTPQISEAVSALVRLIRTSLGKNGDFLPLHEELGLVRDYLEIQTFRYGDEIELITDIEPTASLCLVPRLILQPLVENAIIHGLDYKNGKDKRITIKAWLDRDLLYCQVEDNGKGMDPEQLMSEQNSKREGVKEKMSGIGLKHIREKIKLYYGPDYKMVLFSKPNQGTTVRISLPIHRSDET